MKRVFYGLGGLVFLLAAYIVFRPKPIIVESAEVRRGPFVETLSAEGKVRSRDKRTVYAFGDGNLGDVAVKLGDEVKKDQVVAKLIWDSTLPVKIPIDGVVTKVHRDSAGPIARGSPILEVSSLRDLEVVAEVLTPEAIQLKSGGEAEIVNWGGEGALKATIGQVSRAGAVKVSALGVEEERTEVTLTLTDIPEELKRKFGDNYHVDVMFQVSREENVLKIPLGSLFKLNEKWAVYVITEGRAKSKVVEIGKRNDRETLVLTGVQEGERVIVFPGDRVREGALVKF